MNIENKHVKFLIKYRKTISGSLLAIVMILCFWVTAIISVTSKEFEISRSINNFLPWILFVFFFVLLIFYMITGILKSKFDKKDSIGLSTEEPIEMYSIEKIFPFFSKKLRIFFVGIATFIPLIILFSILVTLFDLEINIDTLIIYFIYIGAPIWILATWKFFNKHLK